VQDANDLMQRLIDVAAGAERSVIDTHCPAAQASPCLPSIAIFSYDKMQGRSLYII